MHESAIDLEGPLWFSGVAVLREDLNYARRRFRAIQRRRRGALDDFDSLDVVRIDVVHRARDVVAAAQIGAGDWYVALIAVASEAHAIDVNERLVAHRDAHVAAKADHR